MTSFSKAKHNKVKTKFLSSALLVLLCSASIPVAMAEDSRTAAQMPAPASVENAFFDDESKNDELRIETAQASNYFDTADDRMGGSPLVRKDDTGSSTKKNDGADQEKNSDAQKKSADNESGKKKSEQNNKSDKKSEKSQNNSEQAVERLVVPSDEELPHANQVTAAETSTVPLSQKTEKYSKTRPTEAVVQPAQAIPIEKLEHYGLLVTPADKSLGIDLWIGSQRPQILNLIEKIPAENYYASTNDITRRLLLTETEPDMISGARPNDGRDLMSVRLAKLIDTGDFDDAAKLYAVNPGLPPSDRLARVGVSALLYSGRSALGCLETKAYQALFKNVDFWSQLNMVCDVYMTQAGGMKPSVKVPNGLFPSDSHASQAIEKSDYLFRPSSTEDLDKLSDIDRIALITLNRIDYGKLADYDSNQLKDASPASLSLMLSDSKLPSALRFNTLLAALSVGAAKTSQLAAYYDNQKLDSAKTLDKNHEILTALYQKVKATKDQAAREYPLQQALAMEKTVGIQALLPFAPFLSESDPARLPPESITSSLAVMVKANQNIPQNWSQLGSSAISPLHKKIDDTIVFFAYDVDTNFKPLKNLQASDFKSLLSELSEQDAALIIAIYEKLDKDSKLHNIEPGITYEKEPRLTGNVDYVMPVGDLLSALDLAKKDKRLGEVILISSILLRSTPTGSISPEVISKVLDGYLTVGLTREARDLAAEVILGLRI
jgi:hypothetical protein